MNDRLQDYYSKTRSNSVTLYLRQATAKGVTPLLHFTAAVACGLRRAAGAGLAAPPELGRYRVGSAGRMGVPSAVRLAGRVWLAAAVAMALVKGTVATG